MRSNFACILSLISLGQLVLGNVLESQAPLGLAAQDDRSSLLSLLSSPGVSAVDGLSDFIMNSLSADQREDLMVKLWEQHDVVEVMKMTGHGEGLDERKIIDVFGQGLRM